MEIKIAGAYIEITGKCNLKCKFCYNDSTSESKQVIEYSKMKEIIDKLVFLKANSLSLSGGEPLLHPNFNEIVKYAYEKGLIVTLTTNGVFLRHLSEDVLKMISNIQISLDGSTSEIHDSIRGLKGTFDNVIKSIEWLNSLNYTNLTIKMVLNKMNKEQLNDYIKLGKKYNVKDIRFSFVIESGRAVGASNINLSLNDKKEIIKTINTIREKNLKDETCKINVGQIGTTEVCPFVKENEKEVKFNLKIDSYGNVFPCQIIDDKRLSLGNVYETSLLKMFELENINKFLTFTRNRQSKISKCMSCVWQKICKGGCIGTSFRNDNLYNVDADCELRKNIFKLNLLYNANIKCDCNE